MTAREDQLRAAGGRTRPGVILALACTAQFMVILDLVVVNVALPTMQVEQRVTAPLIPLAMFRLKSFATANIIAGLVMGSFFGTAFQITLFLQQVLGYSPLRTGAAGVITAVSSIIVASAIAARVVGRLGAARTLVVGQAIAVGGLLYLSRAPVYAAYWSDLFPAFLASGIGIGLSVVAVQVAAFTGVRDKVSGLAGDMVSTAQEAGAALGLAIIATVALAQDRSRTPPAARPPSVLLPRPQASSAARWWLPDSALPPRSPPGSCSGEPKR